MRVAGFFDDVDTSDANLATPELHGDTLVIRAQNVSVLAPHPLAEPARTRVLPESALRFRQVQSCRREIYVAPDPQTGTPQQDLVREEGPFPPLPAGVMLERFELEGGSADPWGWAEIFIVAGGFELEVPDSERDHHAG